MSEYSCDKCGDEVPNGSGHYILDDRLCSDCYSDELDCYRHELIPSPTDNKTD